tara:strand:- start:165 stop:473 length:309 start_codon:yes stop_codon:yes gene_type:complete
MVCSIVGVECTIIRWDVPNIPYHHNAIITQSRFIVLQSHHGGRWARWFGSAFSLRASYNRLWRLYKGDILIRGGENTDKAVIVLQRAREEGRCQRTTDNDHV